MVDDPKPEDAVAMNIRQFGLWIALQRAAQSVVVDVSNMPQLEKALSALHNEYGPSSEGPSANAVLKKLERLLYDVNDALIDFIDNEEDNPVLREAKERLGEGILSEIQSAQIGMSNLAETIENEIDGDRD